MSKNWFRKIKDEISNSQKALLRKEEEEEVRKAIRFMQKWHNSNEPEKHYSTKEIASACYGGVVDEIHLSYVDRAALRVRRAKPEKGGAPIWKDPQTHKLFFADNPFNIPPTTRKAQSHAASRRGLTESLQYDLLPHIPEGDQAIAPVEEAVEMNRKRKREAALVA